MSSSLTRPIKNEKNENSKQLFGNCFCKFATDFCFFVHFESSFQVSRMYLAKTARVQKYIISDRGKVFYLITVFLCIPNIPNITMLVIILVIFISVFVPSLFITVYLVIFTYVKLNVIFTLLLLVIKSVYPLVHTGVCVNLEQALSPITNVSKTKELTLKVSRIIYKG